MATTRGAQTDPLVGSLLGKDYQVLERIGMGGMAIVYLVEHQTLHKRFAAKVLSPEHAANEEARARFTQEAHAASHLDHENIVTISDFGITPDDRPYYVMELLRGQTLMSRLEEGPMTLEEVVAVSVPVARALAHAHAEGVIHRDVKPENVFLVQRSQGRWGVKVLDFGIAKVSSNPALTKMGQALGSPMFMAPEACRGDDVDQRADLYSFGVMLYLMLTGRVPFQDESLLKVLQMQVSSPVPPPREINPSLSEELEEVLLRALAKNADDRYPTMEALLMQLQAVLPEGADSVLIQAQHGTAAQDTPFPSQSLRMRATSQRHMVGGKDVAAEVASPAPKRKGGALIAVGVAAAVLAAGGVGYWQYMQAREADEHVPVAAADPAMAPPTPAPTPPQEPVAPIDPAPAAVVAPTEPVIETPVPTQPAVSVDPKPTEPEETKPTVARTKSTPTKVDPRSKRVAAAGKTDKRETTNSAPAQPIPPVVQQKPVAPPETQPVVVAPKETVRVEPPPAVGSGAPSVVPVKPTQPAVARPAPMGSLDATPSIASLDVNGPLPSSVVRRAVERALPGLRTCYQKAAKEQKSTPSMKVSLSFEVDENRAATGVSAGGAKFGSLTSCAKSTISGLSTQQAPDVGTASVVVQIAFRPI